MMREASKKVVLTQRFEGTEQRQTNKRARVTDRIKTSTVTGTLDKRGSSRTILNSGERYL